jgi:hypothetical protein
MQIKRNQAVHGLEHLVREAVIEYQRKNACPFSPDEMKTIIAAASRPMFFSNLDQGIGAVTKWGYLYARNATAVLGLMLAIRLSIDNLERKKNGIIQKFLLTHRTVVFRAQRDITLGMTENEIKQYYASGKLVAVSDLTDKEIAQHLSKPSSPVTADDVKKARQSLSS